MNPLRDPEYRVNIHSLTKALLVTVGVGTVLAMALMAPNTLQILKPFLGRGTRKDHERKRIRQALDALHKQKMLERIEKNGNVYLRTTKKGHAYLRRLDVETLTFPKPIWDRKWRIIFFDIPEEKGRGRRAFQQRLKTLGCMQLQKSVFIYPHACPEEIDMLTSFWKIFPFVHYCETSDLGTAQQVAKQFFGL